MRPRGKLAGSNVQNVAYFLSDGQPTSGDEISGGLNTGRQGTWTSFLNTNDIDSFALGMGSASNQPAFQAALNPIAFDGRGAGTDTNGISGDGPEPAHRNIGFYRERRTGERQSDRAD